MAKVSNSKDLLMLLLYAKGHRGKTCESVRGRTRLMKIVFLFDKEIRRRFNLSKAIPDEAMPDFTAFDYGPFSAQVFADLEFLVDLGFVKVTTLQDGKSLPEEALEYEYWQAAGASENDHEDALYEEVFSLTPLGRDFVKDGQAGRLTPEQWKTLDKFKARCTAVPLRALLQYIYTKYPEMTTASKIRDKVLSEYEF